MKRIKIVTAMLIALVLILNIFAPSIKVFAITNSITISFKSGYTSSQGKVQYSLDDGTQWIDVTSNITNQSITVAGNNLKIKIVPESGYNVDLTATKYQEGTNNQISLISDTTGIAGALMGPNGYQVNSSVTSVALTDVEFSQNGGGNTPTQTTGNTQAIVKVKGGTGTYTEKHYNPATGNEEEVQVPYAETYVNARIKINGSQVRLPIPGVDPVPETFIENDFSYNYDNNTNPGTVDITFETIFNRKFDRIKVNNTTYTISNYINYSNRESWLDHYEHQGISFTIPGVAKADTYEIEVDVADADKMYVGNFLWTADPEQEYRPGPSGPEKNDDYIGHSKINLVKVEYERNGQTISKTLNQLTDLGENEEGTDTWHNYRSNGTESGVEYGYLVKKDGTAVNYDDGSLVVPEGARVTMKIVPDYGYQVTAFSINGGNVITGDSISEFTFTVNGGNAHIGATVAKVGNDVKSNTAAISGGSIELGNNEITTGTARLSISDATVSDAKTQEFTNAAGSGFTVSNVLDIDLNQVFYKGTGSNDDVWNGAALENLNDEATIALQFADGIDPTTTEVVHNIHDGDDYEVLPIEEYDANTKTGKVKVKGFSNFAIVTKEAGSTSNPKTGDIVMVFAGIFALSTVGFVVTRRLIRKK